MSAPRVTCSVCGATMAVLPDGRGHPPDIARRRLAKRCGHKVTEMTYRPEHQFGDRPTGQ